MEISKYSIDPYNTEHAGSHDDDDSWRKALSNAATGCNRTIHEGTEGIGEAHDSSALKPCFDDGFVIGEQRQKLSAKKEQSTSEHCTR